VFPLLRSRCCVPADAFPLLHSRNRAPAVSFARITVRVNTREIISRVAAAVIDDLCGSLEAAAAFCLLIIVDVGLLEAAVDVMSI
jgi:hypothetical protein